MGKVWKWIASFFMLIGTISSSACWVVLADEPEMPKCMLK